MNDRLGLWGCAPFFLWGNTVSYQGDITFDPTQPDGAPRKLMDSSRLNALGWQAQIGLEQGLALAYQDFLTR